MARVSRKRRRVQSFRPSLEELECRVNPSTVDFRGTFLNVPVTPAVVDMNGDGWQDLLGHSTTGTGT